MTTISIDKLRTDVEGRVIGPDDPGLDQARAVFYGGIDRRPRSSCRSRTTPTSPR